jgi:UDP-glucose 4-epimerase
MGPKYVVTGGAGFIGSHLVDALLDRGGSVVVLDTLFTGRLANLDHAGQQPNFRFVQGSVLDQQVVDELVSDCDTVVHLASPVGSKLILQRPLDSFRVNIRGSRLVIEAAHRYRRQLLLASTSEIYGKNSAAPLVETSDRILGPPSSPRWAASTAAAVAEVLAYAYQHKRQLPVTVVRLFNTVGSRQSPLYGNVIPRLVRQALSGEPLTVYGDGRQTRCFCHVADVIDGFVRLLDLPDAQGQVFNLGSPEEISMLDLARRIRELVGSSSRIDLVPYSDAYTPGFEDVPRRVPDLSRIRTLTGWQPTHTLDDILTETIAEAAAEDFNVAAGIT